MNLNNIESLRGNKIMKSKLLPTIFRAIVILTFICGIIMMFWMVKFMLIVVESIDIQSIGAARQLGHLGESFLLFLFMTVISFAFSLICFKASTLIESIGRTLSITIAGVLCVPALNVMLFFIDMKKFYVNEMNAFDYVSNIALREKDILCACIPMLSFTIMLAICITSILALIMGPVLNEKSSEKVIIDDDTDDESSKKGRKGKKKSKKDKKKGKKKKGKNKDDDSSDDDNGKKSKKKKKKEK